jgi:hypothetical protein
LPVYVTLLTGEDDHLIPVAEARHIANQLEGKTFEYIELKDKSHFFDPWKEILDVMDVICALEKREKAC